MKFPKCLKGLFAKKDDRLNVIEDQGDKECSSASSGINKTDPEKAGTDIDGAITPDRVCRLYADRIVRKNIRRRINPFVAPNKNNIRRVTTRKPGILVNGHGYFPQFIPDGKYVKDKNGKPTEWQLYESGFLLKDDEMVTLFYPNSIYRFDESGAQIGLDDEDKHKFKPIGLEVYNKWREESRKTPKKKESKKGILPYVINCAALLFFVLLIIICILYACGYRFTAASSTPLLASSSCASVSPTDLQTSTRAGSTGSMVTTTTIATTTASTKSYPSMTAITRIPAINLSEPTFEIISAVFELKTMNPGSTYDISSVTFTLNVTSKTDTIHLRCAVRSIGGITLNGIAVTDYTPNKQTQLLTMKLPKPSDQETVTLRISYMPSDVAFERLVFPCGSKKCSVYLNRQLSLLVPHFDYSVKHTWTITVEHQQGLTVLANSKTTATSSQTSSSFQKTSSLLPSELSIVIMENIEKHSSGKQVNCYRSRESHTNVKDVTELVGTLEKALESKAKLPIASELFSIVVVSGIETYQFYGRNVALVGGKLLMANIGIKNEFVWRFIFRTIIYNKVSSNDKNPTWVYEQSAFFLSTMIKSNNKNMWKKHLYGSAMDSGYRDIKGLSNQAMSYEDEHRYLDKYEHNAKVSTVLAMVTSLGSSVSGDPLTILDEVRDNSASDLFFFVNKQLKLQNGQMLNVDVMTTCYVDSPVTPRVHISRVDPSHVLVQRTDGGEQSCDMYLCYVRDKNNKATTTKEYMLLSSKEQKVTVEAKSAILLSGDSPFSAYGYTMEQREFDRLVHEDVLASFDDSSLNMLASNAFRAAFEGKLSYESLHSFMKMVVSRKVVSVDEAVDLWMGTLRESRNDSLKVHTESIIAIVLNATGQVSDSSKTVNYIYDRLQKSINEAPLFEIEKMAKLVKDCGRNCFESVPSSHRDSFDCATGYAKNCVYNLHSLETYGCSKAGLDPHEDRLFRLYNNCTEKPCRIAVLRGLLCTNDIGQLQSWLEKTTNSTDTDMMSTQLVKEIFKGLASNDVAKPLLFPFLIENWHLIQQKYSKLPSLLGEIIDTLASTINTSEQLEELKQFVTFHGENLDMYREFQEQIVKAEKVIEWNKNLSDDFNRIFI